MSSPGSLPTILTCSPLFLGSAWRGSRDSEWTKAPWDELPGQTAGRGHRNSRDLRPGRPPPRPLGGQRRLNHSTPRCAQHSSRSAVLLAAAGPAALPELAAITLGTSRVSFVTQRCQHLHKWTRVYVYWPIEPAEHLYKTPSLLTQGKTPCGKP